MPNEKLTSKVLTTWLNVVGWLLFAIGVLFGVVNLLNALQNQVSILPAIIIILSSIVTVLICLGLGRLIEQNSYLIEKNRS